MTRREDCTSPSSPGVVDGDGSRPKLRCLSLKMRRRKRDIAKTKHNDRICIDWIMDMDAGTRGFDGKWTGSPHLLSALLREVVMVGGGRLLRGLGHLAGAGEAVIG